MKTLASILLLGFFYNDCANAITQESDPWGIKKAEKSGNILFNSSTIKPLNVLAGHPLFPGAAGEGYTYKIFGLMKDKKGVPTILLSTACTEDDAGPTFYFARPYLDSAKPYQVKNWEMLSTGFPVPGKYFSSDGKIQGNTFRVFYGSCLAVEDRVILMVKNNSSMEYFKPETILGFGKLIPGSGRLADGTDHPEGSIVKNLKISEIEKKVRSGECKEIPGENQYEAP